MTTRDLLSALFSWWPFVIIIGMWIVLTRLSRPRTASGVTMIELYEHTQGRDAQRPELAVGLRDEHSSDGVRSVSLLPERKRQFAEPPLHPNASMSAKSCPSTPGAPLLERHWA